MDSKEYLKTATPEDFMQKCTKSTQGGPLVMLLCEIGIRLAGEASFSTDDPDLEKMVEVYKKLILSEFNNVLNND